MQPATIPPILFQLSPIASRICLVIWSLLEEGESRQISNAQIAEVGHISEGTVSRAIWVLYEQDLIDRQWDPDLNNGRGGYLITRLPTPAWDQELIPQSDEMGSIADPSPLGSGIDPMQFRTSALQIGHCTEPDKNVCMVHESHESHELVSEARERAVPPFPDDPDWPQWEALGVYPEAYPDLRRDFPQVSLAQFSFWCSQLHSKRSPAGFVIYSLKNQLPLPRQRTQAPPPIETKRTRGRRVPPAPQMPPPPTADEEARNAAAWQQVAEICPPGASDLDQVELVSDLLDGFSADQALARLASRRQAAAP